MISAPSTHLATAEFALRPITVDDAQRDYEAVMETREDLRLWEQSDWPTDDFTVEDNLADLTDMATRTASATSHDYTVISPDGNECLGCVYVFPTSAAFLAKSTVDPLAHLDWHDVDAVVYFWARKSRADAGMSERLLTSLRAWFAGEWHLDNVVYAISTVFTHQLDLLNSTDLDPLFELREPDKADPYLLFGKKSAEAVDSAPPHPSPS